MESFAPDAAGPKIRKARHAAKGLCSESSSYQRLRQKELAKQRISRRSFSNEFAESGKLKRAVFQRT
jgi:hypothetical protein